MDGRRFDAWTRAVTTGVGRRAALRAAAGAAVAGTLGLLRVGEAEALLCRRADRSCQTDSQCCSNRCKAGRCQCLGRGAPCTLDKACCSKNCRQRGTCA